jgi:DNA repair exonuclease SbcCD ATPase subunit
MSTTKQPEAPIDGNPTEAEFNSAVQKIENRGGKLTVRGIISLTGGTTSVVNQRLRRFREQRKTELEEMTIPEDFTDAVKRLMRSAQEVVERKWRERQRQDQEALDELSGLLHEMEQAKIKAQAGEQSAKDALRLERELRRLDQQDHADTKEQLKDALTEADKLRAKVAKVEAERDAANALAQSRASDHEVITKRMESLESALRELQEEKSRQRTTPPPLPPAQAASSMANVRHNGHPHVQPLPRRSQAPSADNYDDIDDIPF